MARVNKAKKKAAHDYLIRQENQSKSRKDLVPVTQTKKSEDVKMGKNSEIPRETRREKISRKKLETKKRKAPSQKNSRMEIEDAAPGAKLPVKKTLGGIHKH